MPSPRTYTSKRTGQTYHGKAAKAMRALDGRIEAHGKFNYGSRQIPGAPTCK